MVLDIGQEIHLGPAQDAPPGRCAGVIRHDGAENVGVDIVDIDRAAVAVDDHQPVRMAIAGRTADEGLKQADAVLILLFRDALLHLAGAARNERGIMRAEYVGMARQIDHTDDLVVEGVVNGRAGAGPGLDACAEMLCRVNEDRAIGPERGADAVRSRNILCPAAADAEMDIHAVMDRPLVADDVDQHAVGVGEHQHGAGALQQLADCREGLPCREQKLVIQKVKLGQRRPVIVHGGFGPPAIDAAIGAARPGILDHAAYGQRRGGGVAVTGEKALPGAHHIALVILCQDAAWHAEGRRGKVPRAGQGANMSRQGRASPRWR